MSRVPSTNQHGRLPPLAGLLVIAALSVAAIALVSQLTREKISANEANRTLEKIWATLPAGGFDNQPHMDALLYRDTDLLGTEEALATYRARDAGNFVAAVVTIEAPDGYVAPIRLLVGISADGEIITVRTLSHRETPGLGDQIDISKSDWIDVFAGRKIANDDPSGSSGLALRRDGGDIDHITGATITSRAVVNAVANSLRFYASNRDTIHSAAPQTQ